MKKLFIALLILFVSSNIFAELKIGNTSNFAKKNVDNSFTATQTISQPIISTIATGTAPFSVASNTKVTSLNVGYVSDYHFDLSSPTADQLLVYNGTSFVNRTIPNAVAGAGVFFYLDDTASGVVTFNSLLPTPDVATAEETDSATCNSTVSNEYGGYISTAITRSSIEAGEWEFTLWAYVDSNVGVSKWKIDTYKRSSVGVETLLFTEYSPEINAITTVNEYIIASTQPEYDFDSGDMLLVKLTATTDGVSTRTLYFTHNGSKHYSFLKTPLSLQHNSLPGLNNSPYFHSDQAILQASSVTFANINSGGTITGSVLAATTLNATSISGTLSTASQPNITTVGSLGDLNVVGTVTANKFADGTIEITGGSISGASTLGVGEITSATTNSTAVIQLNSTDINTAGTLSNVAYENQINSFTATQTITNGGSNTNSYKLTLDANNGGETQTSSIQTLYGADPYMRTSVPNDSGAETAVFDIHDTVIAFTNDNTVDIGANGANRPKDLYAAGTITCATLNATSIAGTITTDNVSAITLNATTSLQFNSTDINTAGTLTNVAYENQENVFTVTQNFNTQVQVTGNLNLVGTLTTTTVNASSSAGVYLYSVSGNSVLMDNNGDLYFYKSGTLVSSRIVQRGQIAAAAYIDIDPGAYFSSLIHIYTNKIGDTSTWTNQIYHSGFGSVGASISVLNGTGGYPLTMSNPSGYLRFTNGNADTVNYTIVVDSAIY